MTIHESLAYLAQLENRGIRLGLDPLSRLLATHDNPHLKCRTVLIGGTNGKGSVAAMLSSVLRQAGYRVGLYTSPHLLDFRERIRVDGKKISKRELARLIEQIRHSLHEDLTYFEFATAIAFFYFELQKVDIAILEVGMGGRLDATNLARPDVAVITNISREHCDFLGHTLGAIAGEKAAIIHEGGVCVTAARQRSVRDVLAERCRRMHAQLYRVGREIRYRCTGEGYFSYYGKSSVIKNLVLPLVGRYQYENACCALAVLEFLNERGLSVGEEAVAEGLGQVQWAGRMERIGSFPPVIVDGAHNPSAVSALCRSLREDFSYDRLIVVFGVLGDKNYRGMLRRLAPLADRLILTGMEAKRAVNPACLEAFAKTLHACVESVGDSGEALARARKVAGRHDLICVTGSLYLVGEMKRHIS